VLRRAELRHADHPACDLRGALADLCRRLPPACTVWLGGCSTAELERAGLPESCVLLGGHGELRERARSLAAAPA